MKVEFVLDNRAAAKCWARRYFRGCLNFNSDKRFFFRISVFL